MNVRIGLLALLVLLLSACSGGGSDDAGQGGAATGPAPATADISLLFMGNSHTSANDLAGMVAAMVRSGRPGETVASVEAQGWMFLEERLHHQPSIDLLRSQRWTSSSFRRRSTAPADSSAIRRRRRRNWCGWPAAEAVPVMFPEWPRRDVPETQRIYDLHVSIAQRRPRALRRSVRRGISRSHVIRR